MVDTIKTKQHVELVRLLRLAREASGLTQAQAAANCGRSQQFIALIESGQRRIDVVEYLKLAKCLDFDPYELLAKVAKVKN